MLKLLSLLNVIVKCILILKIRQVVRLIVVDKTLTNKQNTNVVKGGGIVSANAAQCRINMMEYQGDAGHGLASKSL
jgi:hypothetical protein